MSVIAIRDVHKQFHGNTLFRGISWNIEQGKTYGLIGPNGSGKSVLFKMICGFVRPDAGTIDIDPAFLSHRRTFPEHFGITIDGPAYLPHETGLENLRRLASINKRINLDEVRQSLLDLGLSPDSKQVVRRFSLGMKQKLSLAQAFMEKPAVLLLDEPFNALDEDSVANVKTILRKHKESGTTIVFTSHNRGDIAELSDEVLQISSSSLRPVIEGFPSV